MDCPECDTSIPDGQSICPACYAVPSVQVSGPNGADSSTKGNIIFLIHDDGLRGIFEAHVERNLQPELVRWSFGLATGAELEEVTANSATRWNVFLVDADGLANNEPAIAKFCSNHPDVLVGLLGVTNGPGQSLSDRVIRLEKPKTEDDWIRMMTALLLAARRRAT